MVSDVQDRKVRLEAERRAVYDEIKSYPRPIPACDVQFNTLLAERARLDAELARLAAAPPAGDAGLEGAGS